MGLAVVNGCRSQQARDGDIAIGGIDMQLEPIQLTLRPFALRYAGAARRWQIGQHCGECHASLLLEPARASAGACPAFWAAALCAGAVAGAAAPLAARYRATRH